MTRVQVQGKLQCEVIMCGNRIGTLANPRILQLWFIAYRSSRSCLSSYPFLPPTRFLRQDAHKPLLMVPGTWSCDVQQKLISFLRIPGSTMMK
jgi:hypothetical protein